MYRWRLWVVIVVLWGVCWPLGCGDSPPAGGGGEPTEKQKQKEQMKDGKPEGSRGKSQ
ncbi:MAG: hypothetical protein RMJ56_09335 [Gemmataceae bacterium]|nr:hypothetical protein [Gemmata sp.]MDW8197791.1 hypothetical protein [Gemmataceae bacterium]